MSLRSEVASLIRKEFTLEFRNRFALFGVLLYLFLLAFIVFLSFVEVEPSAWVALYWITLLFVAVSTVARSFVQEGHGRQIYYYVVSSAQATILSKIIYNGALMIILSLANLLLFGVLVGWPIVQQLLFMASVALGTIGLSTAFTLMSAISSKTNNNLGLMAILSIPVFVPMLMLLISASNHALMPMPDWPDAYRSVAIVGALDAITIALALILFPYLWHD